MTINSKIDYLQASATVSLAPSSNQSFNKVFQSTTPISPNNMQRAQESLQTIENKKPDAIKNQKNIATIEFIGKNGELGYYWDSKSTDIALLHPGRAKIGDENFINVMTVDAHNTSYDPGFLNYLGNFSRQNDPIVYFLYGAYVDTTVPTPDTYEFV